MSTRARFRWTAATTKKKKITTTDDVLQWKLKFIQNHSDQWIIWFTVLTRILCYHHIVVCALFFCHSSSLYFIMVRKKNVVRKIPFTRKANDNNKK